jgi:hypothetical protein
MHVQEHVLMQCANQGDTCLTGPAAFPPSAPAGRWAWQLPPAGLLEFVCEWPTLGIPESRAGLDAQLILGAAGQSIRLWPDDEG